MATFLSHEANHHTNAKNIRKSREDGVLWIHPIYGISEPAGEPPISQTGDGLTMAEYAIETIGFGRRFGRIEVLADVSLTVPTGELVGLIGPNGAGKTTLIMLLLGILRPSSVTYEFSRVGSAVGVVLDVHGCFRHNGIA